jgi:hypothetical protein
MNLIMSKLNCLNYAYFSFIDVILSMNVDLLQRSQKHESNDILHDNHMSHGQWITREGNTW